jgi:hypothetical protein
MGERPRPWWRQTLPRAIWPVLFSCMALAWWGWSTVAGPLDDGLQRMQWPAPLHYPSGAEPEPNSAGPQSECRKPCPTREYCMVADDGEARCVAPDVPENMPIFLLPFDHMTEVVCTHGPGVGSHAWDNAFFALDLASAYEGPPAIIRAAGDGIAFVYQDGQGNLCPTPPGTPSSSEPSTCGDSWGNRVKVYHGMGLVTFYVHLASISVGSHQIVRAGDELGIEGWTGAAGHRHLHFSVQRLPGDDEAEWLSHMSWTGTSIPFRMRSWLDGREAIVDTAVFRCPHANIGFARNQPRLRGLPR